MQIVFLVLIYLHQTTSSVFLGVWQNVLLSKEIDSFYSILN